VLNAVSAGVRRRGVATSEGAGGLQVCRVQHTPHLSRPPDDEPGSSLRRGHRGGRNQRSFHAILWPLLCAILQQLRVWTYTRTATDRFVLIAHEIYGDYNINGDSLVLFIIIFILFIFFIFYYCYYQYYYCLLFFINLVILVLIQQQKDQ
jgi:hypothetical protein